MKILIGMEYSGRVRDAFLRWGHDAMSCDFLPTETPGPHYQGDIRDIIEDKWDGMICFPDCTYVCGSGLHWNKRVPDRQIKTNVAIEFVKYLLSRDIEKIALENPIGCLSTTVRKPDQIIQPHWFGEDASKATCLWLKGFPALVPTLQFKPRIVEGKKRWGNQTDSGQNNLGPSDDRWKERSRTYQGIADAMGIQWGGPLS